MDEVPPEKTLVVTDRSAAGQPAPVLLPSAEPFGRAIVVPKLVADAGDKAARRFANFFASIANENTRVAYSRACLNFFAWCETKGIVDLVEVEPFHVGAYLKALGGTHESRPSSNISPLCA